MQHVPIIAPILCVYVLIYVFGDALLPSPSVNGQFSQ